MFLFLVALSNLELHSFKKYSFHKNQNIEEFSFSMIFNYFFVMFSQKI